MGRAISTETRRRPKVSAPITEGLSPHGERLPANPWKGLHYYSEEDRASFFGREREVDELVRIILRDALSVLFARSGLGKTSLLRAAVIPRLREEGCLPVLVRLSIDSPGLRSTRLIVQAVLDEAKRHRVDVEMPSGLGDAPEVTLWAFFQQCTLWSERNDRVVPVLILDQFEEVFTLGSQSLQTKDFLTELGDLAENRMPASLREALKARGERLGFEPRPPSSKVVLALREDFVPRLDALRVVMPSIMRNRFALGPLDRDRAVEVLQRAGGRWVSDDVAHRVADALAGTAPEEAGFYLGGDRAVEPAYLSVMGHELFRRMVARGLGAIDVGLVEAEGGRILDALYERSFAEEEPNVRVFVEDHLLTATGYRASVPLAEAEQVDITQAALVRLVDKRLLRFEDRLGTKHVELAHDLLTPIVRRSRDGRWAAARAQAEKEARAREEAEARARLEADRLAQRRRIRQLSVLALVLAVLAVAATGASVWALRAESQAVAARAEAERLVEFVVVDLRKKLQPLGQLALMAAVNERVEGYYAALGTEGQADIEARRANQRITHGDTLLAQGQLEAALEAYKESLAVSRRLARGDPSNARRQRDVSVGLYKVGDVRQRQHELDAALRAYQEGVDICRGLVEQDPLSAESERALFIGLYKVGEVLLARGDIDAAEKAHGEGLTVARRLLRRDPSNLEWQRDVSVSLGQVGQVWHLKGMLDAALRAYEESLALAQSLSEREPSNLIFARDVFVRLSQIGDVRRARGDLASALEAYQEGLKDFRGLAERDPSNTERRRDVFISWSRIGDVRQEQGELEAALLAYEEGLKVVHSLVALDPANLEWLGYLGYVQARIARVHDRREALEESVGAWLVAIGALEQASALARTSAPYASQLDYAQGGLVKTFAKLPDLDRGSVLSAAFGDMKRLEAEAPEVARHARAVALGVAHDALLDPRLGWEIGTVLRREQPSEAAIACKYAEVALAARRSAEDIAGIMNDCFEMSAPLPQHRAVARSLLYAFAVLHRRAQEAATHRRALQAALEEVGEAPLGWSFEGTRAAMAREGTREAEELVRLFEALELAPGKARLDHIEPLLMRP